MTTDADMSATVAPEPPLMVVIDVKEHNELAALVEARTLARLGPGVVRVARGNMQVADVLVCRVRERRATRPSTPRASSSSSSSSAIVNLTDEPDDDAEADAEADVALERAVERYVTIDGAPALPRDGARYYYAALAADERKTAADLDASIRTSTDGSPHWHQQKSRMRQLRAETGVALGVLVEGLDAYVSRTPSALSRAALRTALARAQRRDAMHVYEGASLSDTADRVVHTLELVAEDAIDTAADWTGLSARSADLGVSVRKAENYTAAWFYRRALVGVPRVSPPIAAAVAVRYPSLRALMAAYVACEPDARRAATLLADVELPAAKRTSTGKARTLGTAASARIYELVADGVVPPPVAKRARKRKAASDDDDDDKT